MPGVTNAHPPYAPILPTWFGKRLKRCCRMACVDGRGVKKTSLYFGMMVVECKTLGGRKRKPAGCS